MPLIEGTNTEQFSPVRAVLDRNLTLGLDVGASVAVIYRGQLVVDLWGGFVDEAHTSPWRRDTLVNVWSTTKTMTFLVALMLVDQGLLDFYAPVARYWPEFGANGKEAIEVRHLMSHTAGLPAWSEPIRAEDLADWEYCTTALARQRPWWEPGTKSGYHAVTQGFLIGEVVRRITGITIGQFFKREVADVLGADFYIGLPESAEERVSLVIPPDGLNLSGLDSDSIAYRTFTSPPLDPTLPRHRWWRAAEIPAANGHGNARSVAIIQSIIANNGEIEGRRFFSPATGDQIFLSQSSGIDQVLGVESHFGMGYGLASSVTPIGPRSCYWGGFGGSLVVIDQELQLTVAYMMNQMRVGLVGDTRGPAIAFAAALAALS